MADTTTQEESAMAWSWQLEDSEREPVTLDHDLPTFTSQSDAETWLGEVWRDLLDAGGTQVSLLEHDRVVYGPMSLLTDDCC